MSTHAFTITEIPDDLPRDPDERAIVIQAFSEYYGQATVDAGFNIQDNKPSAEDYRTASALVTVLMGESGQPLALLVNIIAAVHAEIRGAS